MDSTYEKIFGAIKNINFLYNNSEVYIDTSNGDIYIHELVYGKKQEIEEITTCTYLNYIVKALENVLYCIEQYNDDGYSGVRIRVSAYLNNLMDVRE